MNSETAWKATLGELELQMTRATFNTWLKDARLLSHDGNQYIIGVKNDYAKDWLQNRLEETITRTLSAIVGHAAAVRFVVWSDELISPPPPVLEKREPGGNVRLRPAADSIKTLLHDRYTFEAFIVGDSNRLVHAAAMSVAEHPGTSYNPLFIYGGVGLGKTHLLFAIGHRCSQLGYTVLNISSETFTNDLIQSIRSQKMAEFRERYRTVDVLLIDDIQFIAGKESTQEELFHTFNALHSQGKQVVLSSDRPPKAMVTLEERLQSRFEWGLMADIQLPDLETRLAILRSKAERDQVEIPDEVLNLIARHIRKNIRELEGALNKVVAYAQLSNALVTEKLATSALADMIRQPEKVTAERVLQAVSEYYAVSMEGLRSTSRSRAVSFPRQIAMYLVRSETNLSFPQIGLHLGGRDHSTILYGYEKISQLLETDTAVRRDMMEIKAALYDSASA